MNESQIRKYIEQSESEWLEFKASNFESQKIGENISAISNSIVLLGEPKGYIIWGIENATKQIVGTQFKPKSEKVGNEELENWLSTQLEPRVNFVIHEKIIDEKSVVAFEIFPPTDRPTSFNGVKYIRSGSYTKKLKDHPEKERQLWKAFENELFESGVAFENLTTEEVFKTLNVPEFFNKIEISMPESHSDSLARMVSEKVLTKNNGSDIYSVTNLGAILFCNNLEKVPRLIKRIPRVIVYKGNEKISAVREKEFTKGYALDFENIIDYIDSQVPKNEEIKKAVREETSMYPDVAIRELVANALIHQDFNSKGSSLLIEIFSNRIDISNSGKPLIDFLRFIDEAPKSRNETLVRMMRKIKICEDRGSGIDKVIKLIEIFQLPPPAFKTTKHSTTVTLCATKKFSEMTTDERVMACYQHACLRWVSGKPTTNESLRSRFKFVDKQYVSINKILSNTLDKKLIKKEGSNRWTIYKPYWA